jgi:hypothetical protein
MQRRVVFVVALVVVLAGIAGWCAWSLAPSITPLGSVHERSDGSAVAVVPRAGNRQEPPAPRHERNVPEVPPVFVRVVDERGAPVAGADVTLDVSAAIVAAEAPLPFDVEVRLANALRVRTGDDGVARLVTDATRARVVARAGERFGERVVQFDDPWCDTPELRIAPDRNVEIVVIGPEGEPRANVPVDADFPLRERGFDDHVRTLELPFSDANGRVMLWHVQSLGFWPDVEPVVTLRARVLGAPSTDVRVALAGALVEPVRVPCSPHGSIRVRTLVAPGVRNSGPYGPEILFDGATGRMKPVDSCAECVFTPLALAREWRIEAIGFPKAERSLMRDGEVVDVDLVATSLPVVVRLLRPDGRVAAHESIRLGSHESPPGSTNAEGLLGLVLLPELTGTSTTLFAPTLNASIDIDTEGRRPDARGVVDLGVVQLKPRQQAEPVLVEGRVIDATTGRPVSATVTTELEDELDVESSAGTFRIRGNVRDAMPLEVRRPGYAGQRLVVRPGDRDVVIALHKFPHLVVTMLVDPGINLAAIAARLRYSFADHDLFDAQRTVIGDRRIDCIFDVETDDDITLEVQGAWFRGLWHESGSGPPPLAVVPRRDWGGEAAGFAVTVDLRGAVEQVSISATPRTTSALLFTRGASTSGRWDRLLLDDPTYIIVPRGVRLDGIAIPRRGFACEAMLAPGANEVTLPPGARIVVTVEDLPKEKDVPRFELRLYLLERREPLLDRLADDGEEEFVHDATPWPQHGETLLWERFVMGELVSPTTAEPRRQFIFEAPCRGRFAAIPYFGDVPVLDAAVPIEVSKAGESISATVRLDTERVRAALRAGERR